MKSDKAEIRERCIEFLSTWNRKEWIIDHYDDETENGTIDPLCISDTCRDLDVGDQCEEWNCIEGWSAGQAGNALVIRWWREPYPFGFRHRRDLWVVIDADYFSEDNA